MADVLKTSIFAVDVERSIAGLRTAADALAESGAPADSLISAHVIGQDWLHVEAQYLYLPDDDSEVADEPSPVAGARP